MDFFEFEQALIRLKNCVGVRTDKDVARLLEMDVSALNKRKTRGSFPAQKLNELVVKRPDLNLDATYVLTGRTQREAAVDLAASVVVSNRGASKRLVNPEPAANALREQGANGPGLEHDERLLVDAYRASSPAGRHAILANAKAFAEEAKKGHKG